MINKELKRAVYTLNGEVLFDYGLSSVVYFNYWHRKDGPAVLYKDRVSYYLSNCSYSENWYYKMVAK